MRLFTTRPRGRTVTFLQGSRNFGLRALVSIGVALAVVWQPVPASAQQTMKPAEIIYGFPENPPRSFINAQGQPDGYFVHLAKALFAKAGIPWRGISLPASRVCSSQSSSANFYILMAPQPVVKYCCLTSKVSVGKDEVRVFSIGNKPQIKSKEQLVGKNIITIRGFSYAGLNGFISDAKNRITSSEAGTHEAAFEMLAAGRADYLLDFSELADIFLATHPVANLRSDVLGTPNYHYLVLSKDYPDAEKTLARLEAIVKTLNLDEFKKLSVQ